MHTVICNSADQTWRQVASLLLDSSETSTQPSRGGDTIELLHVALEIRNPFKRWVVSRTPALNPAFALVESFWIVAGRRDAALPTFWNPSLRKYCGDAVEYHGAYGHRLRHQHGFDQLDRVYHALQSLPDTRQCVLQIWNSATDMPLSDGSPVNADIPCNVASLPKLRKGKLEWLQVIRSNDLFLGVPHNIVQFTLLQEILSGWLGVKAGSYVQVSDSMHAYGKDVDAIRSSLTAVEIPESSETFALDRSTWDKVFPDVMKRLDALTQADLTPAEFKSIASIHDAPDAYENAVQVAAADAARRRGWHDQVDECIHRCTDAALRVLWSRWKTRCGALRAGNAQGRL